MTDTLSYIEVTENTPTRYRATHHPSGIQLYITEETKPYIQTDKPYSVAFKRDGEWIDGYDSFHETLEQAAITMFKHLNEILGD